MSDYVLSWFYLFRTCSIIKLEFKLPKALQQQLLLLFLELRAQIKLFTQCMLQLPLLLVKALVGKNQIIVTKKKHEVQKTLERLKEKNEKKKVCSVVDQLLI